MATFPQFPINSYISRICFLSRQASLSQRHCYTVMKFSLVAWTFFLLPPPSPRKKGSSSIICPPAPELLPPLPPAKTKSTPKDLSVNNPLRSLKKLLNSRRPPPHPSARPLNTNPWLYNFFRLFSNCNPPVE